ncbi:MAG: hypothetical protein MZV63_25195 [Marinilabiliales bacterium]|nr:hypothetical protein [Marinilabiliales bacterium]
MFYRQDRFYRAWQRNILALCHAGHTPGSVGAALTRIATWVRLYDKTVSDTLCYFNTHFDHISDSARVMSSGVLLDRVREIAGDNNFVITGDFNALPGSPVRNREDEGRRICH